jgi:hypothetical protein
MKTKVQIQADGDETRKQPTTYVDLVWVQCKGYRCLAYTDTKGKWINFYTGKKLTDFIEVIEEHRAGASAGRRFPFRIRG